MRFFLILLILPILEVYSQLPPVVMCKVCERLDHWCQPGEELTTWECEGSCGKEHEIDYYLKPVGKIRYWCNERENPFLPCRNYKKGGKYYRRCFCTSDNCNGVTGLRLSMILLSFILFVLVDFV